MYLIEIRASETNVLTCRAEEFDGNIDLNFINGLKAYISDEEQDTSKALALCAAVEGRQLLIKNQITDEVVFDGVSNLNKTNESVEESINNSADPSSALSTRESEALAAPEVINIKPIEINIEGLNNLDLASALREQIKVIEYLTLLNKVIQQLAQARLQEIPARRAQLDQAEALFNSLTGNPLLGVIKRNELGEISLSQEELENLINLFKGGGVNSPA